MHIWLDVGKHGLAILERSSTLMRDISYYSLLATTRLVDPVHTYAFGKVPTRLWSVCLGAGHAIGVTSITATEF